MNRVVMWVGVLSLLILALSGCVQVKSHVTINSNGSADVQYIMAMDASLMNMAQSPGTNGQDPFTEVKQAFTKDGFTVSDYTADKQQGISATKHVKDARKLGKVLGTSAMGANKELADGTGGGNAYKEIGDALAVRRSLFMTTYKIDTTLDLTSATGSNTSSSSDPASAMGEQMGAAMANSMFEMSFALTLPVKARSSNAPKVSDNGRTLEWPLKLGEENKIQAEIAVPNFTNIGIAAAVLVILLGISITNRLRKRRVAKSAVPPLAPTNPAPPTA